MSTLFARMAVAVALISATAGRDGVPSAASLPKDDKAIVHVLNRLGFGPRPGDVATVRRMGLQRYIEQQLHPERIADDAVAARVAGLTTLGMSAREIAARFEIPQMEARRERRQTMAQGNEPEKRPQATPEMQRANQLVVELSEHKILRAVYSERQLQEVLTDFWFNHFNVDARKGRDRFMLTEYERESIRPYVLGSFRDLLGATAKSPAMLFYLDNWMSADPNGPHLDARAASRPAFGRGRFGGRVIFPRQAQGVADPNRAPRGLNENYARELMELHTLGVDGGYTQKDVTEVARAFTGWTIENPRMGAGFRFEPRIHDSGEKVVLGHKIKAGGGQSDGEQVLDILARHPSTARFIATKLVQRFVSDTPPPAVVNRAAATFRDTNGNLRDVMRTILLSPEFVDPAVYRAKVKTPFEFVVSAIRATAADVQSALPLVRSMQQLGMPLYLCQPPTGYKDTGDAWVSAGALVTRMNIALALASNRMPGISLDGSAIVADQAADPEAVRAGLIEGILGEDVSESTLQTISRAGSVPQMAALTLGAPEFQRR